MNSHFDHENIQQVQSTGETMSQLEILDRETVDEFLEASPIVLMLGKSDCAACKKWTEELTEYLASTDEWNHVRFGKLELDQGGFGKFKKANPWIADLHDLPYNLIYVDGERKKEFAGSGIERLTNRLNRVLGES